MFQNFQMLQKVAKVEVQSLLLLEKSVISSYIIEPTLIYIVIQKILHKTGRT